MNGGLPGSVDRDKTDQNAFSRKAGFKFIIAYPPRNDLHVLKIICLNVHNMGQFGLGNICSFHDLSYYMSYPRRHPRQAVPI